MLDESATQEINLPANLYADLSGIDCFADPRNAPDKTLEFEKVTYSVPSPPSNPPDSKKRIGLIGGIIAGALAIALVGIGLLFIVSRNDMPLDAADSADASASYPTESSSASAAISAPSSSSASASPSSSSASISGNDVKEAFNNSRGYLLPTSATTVYSSQDLERLSTYELYLARNEIFARHGRMFSNDDLNAYFGEKTWYTPRYTPEEFDTSVLNEYERKNIEAS